MVLLVQPVLDDLRRTDNTMSKRAVTRAKYSMSVE